MERNWLIRTSQNQILGPVAKQKLLEFIQKGALGLTDEVSSGNGYWFALKEKDLIEKYIHGDIPQGYNPITESKSVLATRENPDKTSSINSAPVNHAHTEASDITVVRKAPLLAKEIDTKLPPSSDLEFPDVSLISKVVDATFKAPSTSPEIAKVEVAPVTSLKKEAVDLNEPMRFPEDDDLAFPELSLDKTSTKVEKGKVDLSHQYTRTVALDTAQATTVLPSTSEAKPDRNLLPAEDTGGDLKFSLNLDEPASPQEGGAEPEVRAKTITDKKLLHDRKAKVTKPSPKDMRDPTREIAHAAGAQPNNTIKKRNDNYIFFILVIIILIIVAVFFYFKEILNKPLPV